MRNLQDKKCEHEIINLTAKAIYGIRHYVQYNLLVANVSYQIYSLYGHFSKRIICFIYHQSWNPKIPKFTSSRHFIAHAYVPMTSQNWEVKSKPETGMNVQQIIIKPISLSTNPAISLFLTFMHARIRRLSTWWEDK